MYVHINEIELAGEERIYAVECETNKNKEQK